MSATSFIFSDKLDGQFLESIYEGDCEHAEVVFEKFVTSVKIYLGEIESAYESGNTEVLRKSVHKFKPVLSFVGLTRLMDSAAAIEKKCGTVPDVASLAADYTAFKNDLAEMIPVVENDLIKLKALTQ